MITRGFFLTDTNAGGEIDVMQRRKDYKTLRNLCGFAPWRHCVK